MTTTSWYISYMPTAKLFRNGRSQAVRLPKEFRFSGTEVSIHREGESVVLQPIKKRDWPEGFFESIRIDDLQFERPSQPQTPDIQPLSS